MYFTAVKELYNDIYVLLYIIYYVYNGFPFRKNGKKFSACRIPAFEDSLWLLDWWLSDKCRK